MKAMIEAISKRYLELLLFVLLLLIYLPLICSGPLLNRDDTLLLIPLKQIHSWQDYLIYFRSSYNLDLQPIRDISFLLDIFVSKYIGWDTYHLQNVIIWYLCCLAVNRLLRTLGIKETTAKCITLMIALHPLYAGSICWVAARKHLLAFLFLLYFLCYFFSIKERRASPSYILTPLLIFFFLSIFSHPIYSLLPLWIFFYVGTELKANPWIQENLRAITITTFLLFLLGTACQYLNIQHYAFIYQAVHEKPALSQALQLNTFTPIKDAMLAFGRYLFQILVPWSYSTSYTKLSEKNIIGLISLPIVIILFSRVVGKRKCAEWSLFSFFLLAIVVFKIQVRLISDTYLLGGSLGFWILLGFSLDKFNDVLKKKKQLILLLGILLLAALGARSYVAMKSWQSDFSVWANAYAVEPDCANSVIQAIDLFKNDRTQEALAVSKFHFQNHCQEENSKSLFLLSAYYEPKLSADEKIELIQKTEPQSANSALLLASLYLDKNQIAAATKIFEHIAPILPAQPNQMQFSFIAPMHKSLSVFCKANPSFTYCYLGNRKN